MPRFVDLSIYLENDVLSDPPSLAPKIEYQKHRDTLPEFMRLLPGTSTPAAAWATKPRCTCSNAACA